MAKTSFRNKKTLITGAASGIGRATAHHAATQGAELFLTDINAELLDEAASSIRADGGTVSFVKAADVSDYEAVVVLAKEIHATHGSMDIVMNVAGISTWGRIQDLEHRHWQRLVDINLMGPIHILEAFIPPMIEAGRGGHIVNVSSAAGLFGLPLHAAYSATKFGLRGISEVLRFDLAHHDITVSLVCPGAVNTPLVGSVEIVGVDRDNPKVQKTVRAFQRRAVSPDQAGEAIITGVQRGKYMIYTSRDIQVGHFLQRIFPWPYEQLMRRLNVRIQGLIDRL